jgi:hypothetical protein
MISLSLTTKKVSIGDSVLRISTIIDCSVFSHLYSYRNLVFCCGAHKQYNHSTVINAPKCVALPSKMDRIMAFDDSRVFSFYLSTLM